jgi:uncharacterized membrane protein YebE (DUF533 family)
MLRKLITLAAAAGLAKKAYDTWRERKSSDEEREALEAMARDILPEAGDTERKPARKSPRAGGRRRSDGPSAD